MGITGSSPSKGKANGGTKNPAKAAKNPATGVTSVSINSDRTLAAPAALLRKTVHVRLQFITARGPLASACGLDSALVAAVEVYAPPNGATRAFLSSSLNRAVRAYVAALEGKDLTGTTFPTVQKLTGVEGGVADECALAIRVASESMSAAAGWTKVRTTQVTPAKAAPIGGSAGSSGSGVPMEVAWSASEGTAAVLAVAPESVVVIRAKPVATAAEPSSSFVAILLPEWFQEAHDAKGEAAAPGDSPSSGGLSLSSGGGEDFSPTAARPSVTNASASFFNLGAGGSAAVAAAASGAGNTSGSGAGAGSRSSLGGNGSAGSSSSSSSTCGPPIFASRRAWHLLAASASPASTSASTSTGQSHSQLLLDVSFPEAAATPVAAAPAIATAAAAAALSPPPPLPAKPVTAPTPVSSTSASSSGSSFPLCVQPHRHTVYCDRKRAVCTAEGAMRQGNRLCLPAATVAQLEALVAAGNGSASSSGRVRSWGVSWYRSAEVLPSPSWTAEFAAELKQQLAANAIGPHSELPSDAANASSLASLTSRCAALTPAPPLSPFTAQLGSGVTVSMVPVQTSTRTLSSIFPLPPNPALAGTAVASIVAEESSPSYDACTVLGELEAAYATAAQAPDGFPSDSSPLYSTAAALRLLRCEAAATLSDPHGCQHFLTLDDIGRAFVAVATVFERDPATGAVDVVATLRSLPAGPIEPAPPRIRELWLEGSPTVTAGGAIANGVLRARCWYYGGLPSALSTWSFIRVDADGNRSETPEAHCHPFAEGSNSSLSGADPRVAVLRHPDDLGCTFKVCCDPCRLDGAKGAPTTSKPCAEVSLAEAASAAPVTGSHAETHVIFEGDATSTSSASSGAAAATLKLHHAASGAAISFKPEHRR